MFRSARALSVLVAVTLVSACASQPSTPAAGSPTAAASRLGIGGGNLNVRLPSDWNTLDPSGDVIPSGGPQVVIMGFYDRLVGQGPNGDVVPYLAKAWKFPDPSSVLFELRSDVTCGDGTALSATAVANSFTRVFKSPGGASVFGPRVPTITPDDAAKTVQFKWPAPNPDAFPGFTSAYASVICPAGLANASNLAKTPAGSGPYTLTSAAQGASLTLTKNAAWKWGPLGLTASDLPDSITFQVVASETTAANQLLTGGLDVASIQGVDVGRLLSDQSVTNQSSAAFKLIPLAMNGTTGHVTADPQIRRAIMTAIDPMEWNQAAFGGRGVTGTSIFAKNATCYEPATAGLMPKPDLEAAKQILRDAGYTPGPNGQLAKGGQVLTVTVIGTPADQGAGTEYLGAKLTALGLKVTVQDTERATWVARYRAGQYDVSAGVSGGPNVPSAFTQYMAGPVPPQGTNIAYTADPVLDGYLDQGSKAAREDQCAAWSKFQVQVLKNYDMLPLAAPTAYLFTKPKLAVAAGFFGVSTFETDTLRRVP